jgi:hypothetical protein
MYLTIECSTLKCLCVWCYTVCCHVMWLDHIWHDVLCCHVIQYDTMHQMEILTNECVHTQTYIQTYTYTDTHKHMHTHKHIHTVNKIGWQRWEDGIPRGSMWTHVPLRLGPTRNHWGTCNRMEGNGWEEERREVEGNGWGKERVRGELRKVIGERKRDWRGGEERAEGRLRTLSVVRRRDIDWNDVTGSLQQSKEMAQFTSVGQVEGERWKGWMKGKDVTEEKRKKRRKKWLRK